MTEFWQKEIETMPRAELEKFQLIRLKETIKQAMKSPYYGKLYKEKGIDPDSLADINDIRKLPFTEKQDLRNEYPFGFLSVPQQQIIRLHSTSGTTGNPIVVFHTKHDLDSWANLMARSLFSAGARDTDVFQNICGYGLFTGGLGLQYGIERLGALSIPAGAGNTTRQVKLMKDFGTTAVHAIPSYLSRLYEGIIAEGIDPKKDLKLRFAAIGAEPHTEEQRARIEELFGIKAYNSYGLTEMNGPGVAFECTEQTGMHIWEDCYVAEIIDPMTLEPVPDGQEGELVLTTLDRHAVPIIRYRTRDITCFIEAPCKCGRTHKKIARITGRSDDMFIIRGCNVYPMQIEAILMKMPQLASNYLITLDTNENNDFIQVEAEIKSDTFTGDIEALDKLSKFVTREIADEILVTPIVKLVGQGTLPQSEGKAVRVKDLRTICKNESYK